jgi:tetratricopeptide (TPR) repeat protein
MNNLAAVYSAQGKYAQAEALFHESLGIKRRVLGPDHADTLLTMDNLANVYDERGKYAQADVLASQCLEIRRRVLGPEHPDTLWSMETLAAIYNAQGEYAQAEALYSRTLEIQRRVLGAEHPSTLDTLVGLAAMYQRQSKHALAETYAVQALAGRRHALGLENADTMSSAADLALAYFSEGKFAESEPLAREALEFGQKKQMDNWQRFRAESLLGAGLAGQKKYAAAEPLLLEGYQGMLARKDRIAVPDRYQVDCAREWIVELYKAWGNPAKAAEWRKRGRRSTFSSKGWGFPVYAPPDTGSALDPIGHSTRS